MDLYPVWFDLQPGARDLEVCDAAGSDLETLRTDGRIPAFRITRRKFGLGPRALDELHVIIEVDGLAQLDQAFHAAVSQRVQGPTFALYRDFPDPQRRRGEERF